MSIKGKQIIDSTITQPKLNLVDPVLPNDAATKSYVDDNNSIQFESTQNKNMAGLVTASDNVLAVTPALADQPVSGTGVSVLINGIQVRCGDGVNDCCYFSPDGTYKRALGNERVNDNLYWIGSEAGFELDTNDYVDFKYTISDSLNRIVILENNAVHVYNPTSRQNLFLFDGLNLESAIVVIDSTSIEVGNVGGNFAFDIGNINGFGTTFTTKGQNILININSTDYRVVFDDNGALNFTINQE